MHIDSSSHTVTIRNIVNSASWHNPPQTATRATIPQYCCAQYPSPTHLKRVITPKQDHRETTRVMHMLRPALWCSEFSFDTNSPPVGGYIITDLLSATAGVDSVTLQSTSWTDDFDDLPVSYAFGYAHGWKHIVSVTR